MSRKSGSKSKKIYPLEVREKVKLTTELGDRIPDNC